MYFVWFYYAAKAKSFFFFSAANPSIKNGGMAMESKNEIYDLIPQQYIPKTILIKKDSDAFLLSKMVATAGIHFPFIAKPDIGMKAFAVDKIKSETELMIYADKITSDKMIHFKLSQIFNSSIIFKFILRKRVLYSKGTEIKIIKQEKI